jgi:hypothetical protein
MIEDDMWAARGWYGRTLEASAEVEGKMSSEHASWMCLRLLYGHDFLGWNSESWPTYLLATLH